jgi:UDPglucose 6-dehydrogenase
VRLHDPEAMANAERELPAQPGRVTYCKSAQEAANGAHALLLLTEWDEYKKLDLARVRDAMAVPIIIDGRNLYSPAAVHKAGLEYISMGRAGTDHAVQAIPAPKGTARRRPAAVAAAR